MKTDSFDDYLVAQIQRFSDSCNQYNTRTFAYQYARGKLDAFNEVLAVNKTPVIDREEN